MDKRDHIKAACDRVANWPPWKKKAMQLATGSYKEITVDKNEAPKQIWLLESQEHEEDDSGRIIWSSDPDCAKIHEDRVVIGHYALVADNG